MLTPILRFAVDDRIRRWAELRCVDHDAILSMTPPVLARLGALSQPFRAGVTIALLVSSTLRAPFSSGSSPRALPVLALADRWIEVTACALVTERTLAQVTTANDATANDKTEDVA